MGPEFIIFDTSTKLWLVTLHHIRVGWTADIEDASLFSGDEFAEVSERLGLAELEDRIIVQPPVWVAYNPDRALGQNQYVSRYVGGRHGYPDLSHGLRFHGDPSDYHDLRVHRDDVLEFRRRVLAHRSA